MLKYKILLYQDKTINPHLIYGRRVFTGFYGVWWRETECVKVVYDAFIRMYCSFMREVSSFCRGALPFYERGISWIIPVSAHPEGGDRDKCSWLVEFGE